MFVSYILVLSEKGYVQETKFKKEIEYLPVQGEPIVSFYEEVAPFYNFAGLRNEDNEGLLMIDNKLEALSEAQALFKLQDSLQRYVAMIEATDCINLKGSSRGPSHLEELKQALNLGLSMSFKVNSDFDADVNSIASSNLANNTVFDATEYKKIHNELILYGNICSQGVYSMMHCMVKAVNTLLADDNYIDFDLSSKFFATYREPDDEREVEHLSYSDAASCFHRLENYARHIRYNTHTNTTNNNDHNQTQKVKM